jgi:hypothetical protein
MGRVFCTLSAVLALAALVVGCGLEREASSPAGTGVQENHSWGPYHWARTSNPFTLKVGDNVGAAWDAYLDEAISDWSASSVLNLAKVTGQAKGNCRGTSGRIEVCAKTYGNNGWLGLAQIWIFGSHITKAVAKMNDTYFNTSTYNTPAWRRLVMCQEIAHDFGLDHQDENFNNTNLGTCMDYTSDPDGPPSNEHPNKHDYDQLETIYAHLDSTTTVGMPIEHGNADANNWGELVRGSRESGISTYVRDNGDHQVVTKVIWVR